MSNPQTANENWIRAWELLRQAELIIKSVEREMRRDQI